MNQQVKDEAILVAKELIAQRASKGRAKAALVDRFGLQASVVGRMVRTAVHQLYGSTNGNPVFWLAQDCGSSTPLQRRLARRRYRKLMSKED